MKKFPSKTLFLAILFLAVNLMACEKLSNRFKITIINDTDRSALIDSNVSNLDGLAIAPDDERTKRVSIDEVGQVSLYNGSVDGVSTSFTPKIGGEYTWYVSRTSIVVNKEGQDSEGNECHIGKFYYDVGSGKENTFTLRENGTGSAFFADVNGYCSGSEFEFTYTLSNDQISVSYTSAKVCDEEQNLPPDTTGDFSCSDAGIYVDGQFYERR